MTTEETQALALKTLHEAIQALKDYGFITEEDAVGNCTKCNSWDDSMEAGICQTCIKEDEDE